MSGRNSYKHNRALLKGNRLLSLAVVALMVVAVVLTSVFILRKSFITIFSDSGQQAAGPAASAVTSTQVSSASAPSKASSASSKGGSKASSASSGSSKASSASSGASKTSSASSASSAVSAVSASGVSNSSYFTGSLFVGDSITQGVFSYRLLSGAHVFAANSLSVAGARSSAAQLDGKGMKLSAAVEQVKPKRIYLLLGSNDISYISRTAFTASYGKLLDALKKQAPGAKITVQSIFPVSSAFAASKAKYQGSNIDQYNADLKTLCASKGASFADVSSVLRDKNGTLNAAYAANGVNLSKKGYYVWLNYLSAQK